MKGIAVVAALAVILSAAVAVAAPEAGSSPEAAGPRATIYFLHGEKLRATEREVAGEGLEGHIAVLFSGPTAIQRAQGLRTAVPAGTRVRRVWIEKGTVTVDVSRRFEAGGGSLSMQLRLAQLVYTATALAGVDRVRLAIDGTVVGSIGGEGLLVGTPQTRALHARTLAPVHVETPAQGPTLTRGAVTVSGSARTRSGKVTVTLTDGDGLIAGERTVRVQPGVRSAFRVTLPFRPQKPGWGAVVVGEQRAEKQVVHRVELPVRVRQSR
ncbi:MAG TPA: GerMN domain-containing protein [Gaiellaceae bacterium]|nr:GerMN domain-containing protein [Gaiellaceae bacterium]